MGDRADDIATDDTPSATVETSAPAGGDREADSGEETSTTAAAEAGIDDDVLDVSRDLASTVRLQWSIKSAISATVLAVVVAGFVYIVGAVIPSLAWGTGTSETVAGVVFAFFALVGVVRAVLLYRSWTYVVRPDSLFLSRGVLTRVRTVVPYVRVQHVDTRRGPLERVLGLSTLVVYTAGSRGADVRIPGLTPDGATTLQQRLERLAIESEEADAV